MPVTIKDLASEAGVSPTTVSLILNNKPCRVSAQTRQTVTSIADKYSYVPNLSARALVMRQSKTLGLIIPDISNPYFSELAKGVEKEAQKNGYSVIFCNSGDNAKKDVINFKILASRQIDGLIIVTSIQESDIAYANEFNMQAAASGIPVVQFDRRILGGNYDIVSIDHQQGGYIATNLLLDLGFNKIACVTGPMDVPSAHERYNGYLDSLRDHNIAVQNELVLNGDYSTESGVACGEKLCKLDFDAVFASNDLMACGVIKALKRDGKKAGRDYALIGFDNSSICELLDVTLSTVNQPLYDMGKRACSILLKSISSKKSAAKEVVKFSPNLIIRETTHKKA